MPTEQTIHSENCPKEEQGNRTPEAFPPRLNGHCQGERNGGGGSAAKRALQRGQMMELKISIAQSEDNHYWNEREPDNRRNCTERASELCSNKNRQVHLISSGQDAAHRNGAKKLLLCHPTFFDDDDFARPG